MERGEGSKKGTMASIHDGKACFSMIILKDHSTKPTLCIPPQFLKCLSKQASNGVTLTGPSGDHWQVQLLKNADNMYLGEGWQQFVRDNSLGNNEFLIFKYDGHTCFEVQVFDQSGCERFNESLHIRGNPGQYLRKTNMPERLKKEKESRRKVLVKEKIDDEKKGTKAKAKTESTDCPVPFTSNSPHFWRCVEANHVERVFMMQIPGSFARTHLPRTRTEIMLQNREGKSWKLNCIYSGSRHVLAGGWRVFASDNKLKIGDICIFELVESKKMQVHVFH